ncbi:hypothetical protein H1C71_019040, partial [Ictidomys tridecemlineatus]
SWPLVAPASFLSPVVHFPQGSQQNSLAFQRLACLSSCVPSAVALTAVLLTTYHIFSFSLKIPNPPSLVFALGLPSGENAKASPSHPSILSSDSTSLGELPDNLIQSRSPPITFSLVTLTQSHDPTILFHSLLSDILTYHLLGPITM